MHVDIYRRSACSGFLSRSKSQISSLSIQAETDHRNVVGVRWVRVMGNPYRRLFLFWGFRPELGVG